MNNRTAVVVRVAICSLLVSVFCGVCPAQDFGSLPEAKHRVRVSCLGDEVPSLCDMFERQFRKQFPVTENNVHGTYALHIGGHRATDANDPDPFYVVFGILTRTVVYKNSEDGDPEIANHFRRIHTVGTPQSDFKIAAKRFADTFVQDIKTDIAKIQR
jgi:hypothetical protein